MFLGVDGRHDPVAHGRRGVLGQAIQRKRAHLAGHQQRPVDEGVLGRNELDLRELRRELLQRESRLEGCDTSADDQDLGHCERWCVLCARPTSARPLIGLRVCRS
jgi:hypothetical protein